MALQGNATPIASNVTEQAMFDSVPFACSRRAVAHFNRHSGFIGQLLKFMFSQSVAATVASAVSQSILLTQFFVAVVGG